MDVIDFNKLQILTNQLETILSQMEDLVPNNEAEGAFEICQLVLGISDAWTRMESFCYRRGRSPTDIIKGTRQD